jgi:DNA-binding NarL/FixJ family response regulator
MAANLDEMRANEGVLVRSNLVLVEDHAILREGLRALLELEPDLRIVGEAANATDAVATIDLVNPGLVITDIALSGGSGIELIGRLRMTRRQLKILVLTAHNSEEYIRAALNAGADGYVLKDATRADLLQAIRAVLSGQTYLCSSVTAKVVSGYLHPKVEESPDSAAEQVTGREREVLTRVALGESNKIIARALGVSVKTIEKHRANLMRKLTLHNTAAVTRFAIRHGMLSAADLDSTAD